MCWYKQHIIVILLLASIFCGCNPGADISKSDAKYFSLQKYFTAEAARLSQQNAPVLKTVSYNGKPETKTINIKNWQRELDLFISSDINKPAWKDSYIVTQNADSIVYKAIDTTLHTRQIIIRLKASKVWGISISNFTKNMLYQTNEKLAYYPDSLYYIEKHQLVNLLGTNNYQISGKFK